MILRIKPLIGEEKIIEIDPTDQILTVKEKLQEVEDTSVAQQRLMYQGKLLKNEKTVEAYRLKNGAMLQMVKALRISIYKSWLYQRYQNLAVPQELVFLLESLRKMFRIAVITNGTSAAQWEKIDRLDLKSCFDLVLVSGDLSYEKPNKNIFFQACDYLKVKPINCLMVGDKLETDIQGGLQAGLAGTVWIPQNSHYKLSKADPQPDYVIHNIMELKYLLLDSQGTEAQLKKWGNTPLYNVLHSHGESSCSSNDSFSDNTEKPKYLSFYKICSPDEDSNASDGS